MSNEQEIEFVQVETSWGEYIASAHNALNSLSEIDTKLMPKKLANDITESKIKAIEIIIFSLDQLHQEVFYEQQ